MVVGLALNALGGALRGALPDVAWLYAMTVVMGAGVAIMQVTMPPAVRAWLPHRSALPPPSTPTGCWSARFCPSR